MDQFHARLHSLCVAAGPPAPSFSASDIDAALSCVTSRESVAPAFAALDARLSGDMSSTPLSVRSMLWELLVRACDRSAAQTVAQGGRDEWSVVVAPHLYRIVMLVVPKAEDAAANVPPTKHTLRRWMAAAEANSAAASGVAAVPAPFKKPQLINALKYVEGYVYEPPRRSEAEIIAAREAKRERKRQRRKEEEEREERRRNAKANGRRKRSRSRSSHSTGSASLTPGSAAAASANAAASGGAALPADHSPSRSFSGDGGSSRSGSNSRSPSRSPSSRRRYRNRNRSAVTHTASEEAYASRFLEQLRASQKRAHVEGSLRADNESMQGWEEWAETIDYIREGEIQQRAAQREAVAAAAAAAAATAAANLTAASSSPASTAFPAAAFSAPSPSAARSSSLSSFLSMWLSSRNHWKPLRDDVGEAEGTPSEGGVHPMDQWLAYYTAAGLALPSSQIAGGATRLWSTLNDNAASANFRGPLLPPPIPKSALKLYEK